MVSLGVIKQTILAVCVSQAYFCCGFVRGYTSPALPSMRKLNPELVPDYEIVSWIGAAAPLAAFFGSLFAAPIMNTFGRKNAVLLTSPLWVVSWAVIATAANWETVLVGRIISGFCDGMAIPATQIYVMECVSSHIRGILGSIPAISISSGCLLVFVGGAFVAWDTLAWICCGSCGLMFFFVVFMPESPVWLKCKGKLEMAEKSAEWLHLEGFSLELKQEDNDKLQINKKLFTRKVFFSRPIIMPLFIGVSLMGFQQLSGIDTIIFYTVDIFRNAGSSLDENLCTIIVGVLQVLGIIFSLFIVDTFGRKPLLISSGIVVVISTFAMAVAFYMFETSGEVNILPIISLVVYTIGFSVGFGPVPYLIMSEILPNEHRGALCSFIGSTTLLIMFVIVGTYYPLSEIITKAGTFFTYSVCSVIAILFIIFLLPETKGRNFENIEMMFKPKNRSVPERS